MKVNLLDVLRGVLAFTTRVGKHLWRPALLIAVLIPVALLFIVRVPTQATITVTSTHLGLFVGNVALYAIPGLGTSAIHGVSECWASMCDSVLAFGMPAPDWQSVRRPSDSHALRLPEPWAMALPTRGIMGFADGHMRTLGDSGYDNGGEVHIDAHGPFWVEVAVADQPKTHTYTLHAYREHPNKLDAEFRAKGALLIDLLNGFSPTSHRLLPDTMPDLIPIRGRSTDALLMSVHGANSLVLTVGTLSAQDLSWIVGRDIYSVDFARRVAGNADAISGVEHGTLHYGGDGRQVLDYEFRSPRALELESFEPATLSDIRIDERGRIESSLSGTWTALQEVAPGMKSRDLRWTYWDVFVHQEIAVRLLSALAWLLTTGLVIWTNARALIRKPAK